MSYVIHSLKIICIGNQPNSGSESRETCSGPNLNLKRFLNRQKVEQ